MTRPSADSNDVFGFQDRRALVERENQERAAERLAQREKLSSPFLSSRERVALWESLHALRLPVDPRHSLVRVVAQATSLSVAEIHAEQQRRKEAGAVHVER